MIERLEAAVAEQIARDTDPWQSRLARLRGKVDNDHLEKITTEQVLDFLQLGQRARGSGTCRRIASLMVPLGWHSVRMYAPNRRGFREQVRGYVRDTRPTKLSAN